jgi:ATP adenylyltransferase
MTRQLWAPWRMAYVGGREQSDEGCFLCRAADPAQASPYLVERSATTVTVLNRYPYSSGHLMVAPRRHIPDVLALEGNEGAELVAAIQRGVRAVTAAMHPEGFNVGINHGLAAGASIEHLHVHVVPRWGGDTNFMPVIGDVKVLPEQLETTADKLRSAYAGLADAEPGEPENSGLV